MMKKTLLLLAVTIISVLAVKAQDMTLEEILENHFEAIGQEKLVEVKSMKMGGKQMFQGMEFPFSISFKRPTKMRMEVDIQGSKMIQAYNGKTGYMINPMTGSTEPQDVSEEQLKQFKEMSDFDGKLYNYKEKGSTLELVGKEEMEGTEVYNLKLVEKPEKEGEEGDITYYYIDSESYVILKQSTKRIMQGNEVEVENYFSNYKQVDGIAFWHSMEVKTNGNPVSQLTIEEASLNDEIADELFEKPVKEEGK